jgi:hypothetical protein
LVLVCWAGALGLLAACSLSRTPFPDNAAVLREVVNVVLLRDPIGSAFIQAQDGDFLVINGQIQTGDDSLVRLDFAQASFIRLGSNTAVTLVSLGTSDAPLRFQFASGRTWISLFGRHMEAIMPIGTATVEGSFAELTYQPGESGTLQDDVFILKCLEGHCRFQNDSGSIELGNLEQLVWQAGAAARSQLSAEAVAQFLADNPGSAPLIASLTAAPLRTNTPGPTDTPRRPTNTPEVNDLLLTAQAGNTATALFMPTATRTRRPTGIPFRTSTPTVFLPPPTAVINCVPPTYWDPILNRCSSPSGPPPTQAPAPTNTSIPPTPTITPNPTNTDPPPKPTDTDTPTP